MLWHNSVLECAAENRYGAVSELGPRDNKSITGPGIYQLKERPSGIYQLREISQKPIQQTQPTAQYDKSHCRCILTNSKQLKEKTLPHLADSKLFLQMMSKRSLLRDILFFPNTCSLPWGYNRLWSCLPFVPSPPPSALYPPPTWHWPSWPTTPRSLTT